MPNKIAITALIIVLGLVNASIASKENLLANGKVVYLKLAPVDPRSLMQGDYMALRFALADEVMQVLSVDTQLDGEAVALLDAKNIGTFQRIYRGEPLADNEVLLHYRVRNNTVKLATNAFFFQEGHSENYVGARYGQFRVNNNGEILLAALYDEELNRLGSEKSPSAN